MLANFDVGEDRLREIADILGKSDFKLRPDYPLTFSVSPSGEAWGFKTFGHTESEDRSPCDHPLLDLVCKEYLCLRKEGGRFHINRYGAYFGEEKANKEPFIFFSINKLNHSALEVLRTNCKNLTWESIKEKLGEE